jgi:hypothetical protein
MLIIETSCSSQHLVQVKHLVSLVRKNAFHVSSTIVRHRKLITQTRSWENYMNHQEGTKRSWYTKPSSSASCHKAAGSVCVCVYRLACYWLLNMQQGNPHIQRWSHERRRRCSLFFLRGEKKWLALLAHVAVIDGDGWEQFEWKSGHPTYSQFKSLCLHSLACLCVHYTHMLRKSSDLLR